MRTGGLGWTVEAPSHTIILVILSIQRGVLIRLSNVLRPPNFSHGDAFMHDPR